MSNHLRIREATMEDAEAIWQLHAEVYKKIYNRESGSNALWSKDSSSWWKWSNIDNPAKRSYVFVAEDSGKIIGHAACRCLWLSIDGEKELAGINWGTMVHPDYMRQGIARSLLEARDSRERQEGVKVGFSIVTESGRLLLLSTGQQDLGTFTSLAKVINPRKYLQKKTGFKLMAYIAGVPLYLILKLWERGKKKPKYIDIKFDELSFFDSRFDYLWEKVKEAFPISIWRDSEYLNWRYVYHPNVKYKILAARDNNNSIVGYCVFNFTHGKYTIGHIVDFMFLPEKEDSVSFLINAAIDYLKNNGADIAASQMFKHGHFFKLLTSHGFIPRRQGYHWMVRKVADLGIVDVLDVRNWHLTQGDTE